VPSPQPEATILIQNKDQEIIKDEETQQKEVKQPPV
jgi:hypothetical protein